MDAFFDIIFTSISKSEKPQLPACFDVQTGKSHSSLTVLLIRKWLNNFQIVFESFDVYILITMQTQHLVEVDPQNCGVFMKSITIKINLE